MNKNATVTLVTIITSSYSQQTEKSHSLNIKSFLNNIKKIMKSIVVKKCRLSQEDIVSLLCCCMFEKKLNDITNVC